MIDFDKDHGNVNVKEKEERLLKSSQRLKEVSRRK